MVERVIGKANVFEIVFDHVEGDRWVAVTPPNVFGEYVMEIWAYDTAGNASYTATMLYLVSKHTMQAYLIPFEFAGILNGKELIAMLDESGVDSTLSKLRKIKGGAEGGNTEN